jgi:hypothetical protein
MALLGIAVNLFQRFKKNAEEAAEAIKVVDQNTKDLGRSLGVSDAIASKVAASARSIGSAMGVTTTVATQAATQIYSALDGAEQVSQKTLSTFMKLNVFAGMSAESLASMYRFAKLTGESAADVAQNIATTARESIRSMKVNVSLKQVMDGVSKTSNIIKINFKGSAEELTKAFVQSKKLGLELQKVDDIANSLLNFEESIAAEMEAELLTGKDLNLEKAREAALMNDQVGLMEALAEQGVTQKEFANMNRIQQEAIAKSMGLSRESMADMLADAKANEATNTELVDTQAQSLAAMQSMASTAERLAALEEAKALSAAKSGNEMNKLQEAMLKLEAAARPILEAIFVPLLEIFTNIVNKVTELIGKIKESNIDFERTFEVVARIAGIIGTIYGTFKLLKIVQAAQLALQQKSLAVRVAEGVQLAKNKAVEIGSFFKNLGSTALKVMQSFAQIPLGIGIPIGLAAVAGIAALAKGLFSEGDDVLSPGQNSSGYGNRVLLGPEGAISLNNKDTVVAGTNLFRGDDVVSSPAGSVGMGNTARLEMLIERLITTVERGGTVVLDGKKVGEALVVSSYRMQ